MAYLLDANVFIAAKNHHYGFDFCPAFWDWLAVANESGRVFSIESVADEVLWSGDQLSAWARERGGNFFLTPDPSVIPSMSVVTDWAKSLLQKSDPSRGPAVSTLKYLKTTENRPLKGAIDPFGARSTSRNFQNRLSTPRLALLQQAPKAQKYTTKAVKRFLRVADFDLVAQAHAEGHTVVTHEVASNSISKIKVPDACKGLDIECMTPFEMLRCERPRFVLGHPREPTD